MLYDPLHRFKLAAKKQRYVSPAYADPLKALRADEKMNDQFFSALLRLAALRGSRAIVLFIVTWVLCSTTPHLVASKFGVATFIAVFSMINLTKWVSVVVLTGLGLSAVVPPDLLAALIRALSN